MGIDEILYYEDNPKGDLCYTMKIAWRGDLYYKIIFYSIVDEKFKDTELF